MRKVKAAALILDFEIYPRNNLDSFNINAIADAIAAGQEMPPVIIDKASKRVVDGFHRTRAVLKLDPEGEITVIEKTYKDDAALFLDAMRYNASHGARLDPCDRVHCTIIAERLSIPLAAVAGALHMPAEKLGALRNDRVATDAAGLSVPLKRTFRHMKGRKLSRQQLEANERSSGMNQVFYVNQTIDLIESGLLDKEDEGLLLRLRHLHGLLDGLLAAK